MSIIMLQRGKSFEEATVEFCVREVCGAHSDYVETFRTHGHKD